MLYEVITLLEVNPSTGEKLDYIAVARQLDEKIRKPFDTDQVSVHIIGFAQVIGDIAAGAKRVVQFFVLAFFVIGFLEYFYTRSHP